MMITPIDNVHDDCFNVFIAISGTITGFATPELLATGLSETYYRYVGQHTDESLLKSFLQLSRQMIEAADDEDTLYAAIRNTLMPAPGMLDLLNKIITLWYLGRWDGVEVHDQAHQEGLAWKHMGPGASVASQAICGSSGHH